MDLKMTKQPIYAVKFPKNSKWPYLSGILPHFIGGIKATVPSSWHIFIMKYGQKLMTSLASMYSAASL